MIRSTRALVTTGVLTLPLVVLAPGAAFAGDSADAVTPGIESIKDEAMAVVPLAVAGAAVLVAVNRGWGFIRSKVKF